MIGKEKRRKIYIELGGGGGGEKNKIRKKIN